MILRAGGVQRWTLLLSCECATISRANNYKPVLTETRSDRWCVVERKIGGRVMNRPAAVVTVASGASALEEERAIAVRELDRPRTLR